MNRREFLASLAAILVFPTMAVPQPPTITMRDLEDAWKLLQETPPLNPTYFVVSRRTAEALGYDILPENTLISDPDST